MPDYGLDIAVPYTGDPDPTLPWADDDDALLVPGSIMLVDFAHSSSPVSGLPAIGSSIPNIAWKRLRDAVGSAVFTGRIDNGTVGTAGNLMTVTAIAAGKIMPGQVLTGTNVATGVMVLSQVSGTTGGPGVYNVVSTTSSSVTFNVTTTTITANPVDATSGAFTLLGSNDNSQAFARERTPKGGLHVAASQTNQGTDNQYNSIDSSRAAKAWLLANPSHSYYFSFWDTVTKPAVDTGNTPPQMVFNTLLGGGTSNYFTVMNFKDTVNNLPVSGNANRLGYVDSQGTPNSLGNRFRNMGINQATGAFSGLLGAAFIAGQTGAWSQAATYGNKSASRIWYRAYVEDLTLSGRTYADVSSQDQALWAAAFGAGGRYNGDTYTAPTI